MTKVTGSMGTAVLLLVFNRPETTRRVLESIRAVRPPRLYVAADGPRSARADEPALCEQARRAATAVDWPCEVRTKYREENAGCALSVSSAITWFFEQEEGGIILEDDCVADVSFFRFCTELLTHYHADSRIMHIAGSNFQYGRRRGPASYYFSKYPNIWGWASWRRAWNHYDFSLRPPWKLQDTWDTQWQLSIEKRDGLAIVPNSNLVKNIGIGPGATHTRGEERWTQLAAEEMRMPLVHPARIAVHRPADVFTYYVHHRQVRHLQLIWWYQLMDLLYVRLKRVKRRLVGER